MSRKVFVAFALASSVCGWSSCASAPRSPAVVSDLAAPEGPLRPPPPSSTTTPSTHRQERASASLPKPMPLRNLNFQVASRDFDDDDLDAALGNQLAFGIEFDDRKKDSGFGWELALFYTSDEVSGGIPGQTASVDLQMLEALLGGRFTYRLGKSSFFLYGAGGVDFAWVFVDASASGAISGSNSDNDTSFGGYVHGGGYYLISNKVQVGVDVRKSFGLEAFEVDVDYLQLAAFIGIAF